MRLLAEFFLPGRRKEQAETGQVAQAAVHHAAGHGAAGRIDTDKSIPFGANHGPQVITEDFREAPARYLLNQHCQQARVQ